jgi:hypothetical protein
LTFSNDVKNHDDGKIFLQNQPIAIVDKRATGPFFNLFLFYLSIWYVGCQYRRISHPESVARKCNHFLPYLPLNLHHLLPVQNNTVKAVAMAVIKELCEFFLVVCIRVINNKACEYQFLLILLNILRIKMKNSTKSDGTKNL